MYTPCGKVTYELIGKGNSKFTLRQKFDLDEKMVIFFDSLSIYYNDQNVEFNCESRKKANYTSISENRTMDFSFEVDDGVFEGDTIIVYGKNFLSCDETSMALDTMIFSFVNNFRIYGVNYQ